MNRAQNILAFRRVNMHGTKTGPNADPDYAERYHPGHGVQGELFPGREAPDSIAFRTWFGDSVVVDSNGDPLVVYHGTNHPVREFLPGSHFGTAEAANERIRDLNDFDEEMVERGAKRNQNYRLIPVYLSIKNPLEMPDLVSVDTYHAYGDDRVLSWESVDQYDLREYLLINNVIDIDEFENYAGGPYSDGTIYDALSERGYDGIKYRNDIEDAGSTSWIIFDPTQVKSAIHNSGDYNPDDPRIGFKR